MPHLNPSSRRHPLAPSLACTAVLLLCVLSLSPARADEGHDHGGAPAATAPAQPRFAAVSAAFELVGIREGDRLSLWLDHAPDNRPVDGARLELDVGGQAATVRSTGPGRFDATLPGWPAPGMVPVTATVELGAQSDLLVGQLDLHAHDDPGHSPHDAAPAWRRPGVRAVGAAGLGLLLLVAVGATRRLRRRSISTGAAA